MQKPMICFRSTSHRLPVPTSDPRARESAYDGRESKRDKADVSGGNEVSARHEGDAINRHVSDDVDPTTFHPCPLDYSLGELNPPPGRQ